MTGICVSCPHCQSRFRVKPEHAGRRGRCPQCRGVISVPAVEANGRGPIPAKLNGHVEKASALPTVSDPTDPKQTMREVLAAFRGEFPRIRVGLAYRLAALLVMLAMLALPVLYVGMIGLVGYGIYYHAVVDLHWFQHRVHRGTVLLYVAPLVAGVVVLVLLLKPFLSRSVQERRTRRLKFTEEPVLFSFVERLCQAVGAPVPTAIEVDGQVNAMASFRGGFVGMLRKELVLTIGLPLVTGMNTRQLAGVLAHELGHFSQRSGMRLGYVIHSVNLWFAKVVYTRDSWDEWLIELCDSSLRIVVLTGYLARAFAACLRGILWLLMAAGHALSCALSRQMEYHADAYEIRLAGTAAFEETMRRLRYLAFTDLVARQTMVDARLEGPLPEHYPALVVQLAERLSEESRQLLDVSLETERGSLFAAHPTDRDRIAAARRENAPGIFQLECPATRLFHQFDELAVAVSPKLYRRMLKKSDVITLNEPAAAQSCSR